MNSFESERVRKSGKLPIPSYMIATSWLSFFQSVETPENTTFVLILVPFVYERLIIETTAKQLATDVGQGN